MANYEHFKLAYIEAMLWSSNDDTHEGFEGFELNEPSKAVVELDCRTFFDANQKWFEMRYVKHQRGSGSVSEMAGHDFWLTRAGHGAGFWDGDWEKEAADALTKAAKAYSRQDLILGDDGLIDIC